MEFKIIASSRGDYHSLFLDNSGQVWASGGNDMGQLGDGTFLYKENAIPIPIPGRIVEIAAGSEFSLALSDDGFLYVWGSNTFGELGVPSSAKLKERPIKNLFIHEPLVGISAGSQHALAVTESGQVYSFGRNYESQLGNSFKAKFSQTPTLVHIPDSAPIKQVLAGSYFSLALDSKGKIYGWGENRRGQLGNGYRRKELLPLAVPLGYEIMQIAAGREHCLGLTSGGAVFSWGDNNTHEVSPEIRKSITIPVPVLNLPDKVIKIAAGEYFSLALTKNNKVYGWGSVDKTKSCPYPTLLTRINLSLSKLDSDIHQVPFGRGGMSEGFYELEKMFRHFISQSVTL